MRLRALLVDDEALARERLKTLLAQEKDIEIVGECENGEQAVRTITELKPDLVFLDVQMPGLDGFGVLTALKAQRVEPMPAVIFVTAHDRFALRAFEVHALDYLLKPFDRERFQAALKRAVALRGERRGPEMPDRLLALLQELRPESLYPDRLTVKAEGKVVFVKFREIDWIESAGNYVCLHVGKTTHVHRQTMAGLEGQLPPKKFLRISRSTIVNVDRIKELSPMFHGDYTVVLVDGTKLTLSRGYRDKLDELMGKGE